MFNWYSLGCGNWETYGTLINKKGYNGIIKMIQNYVFLKKNIWRLIFMFKILIFSIDYVLKY